VALLVLLGPTVDPQERNFWRIAGRWLLDVPLEPPSLVFIIAHDLWDMGLRRLAACIRVMLADRIEQKLPLIGAPTLVVRGQRDPTVTARWAASAASLLPSGRSLAIAGAAHTVNYNSPATVTRIVQTFVEAWQPTEGVPAPVITDHADRGDAG
jgi:2-hydroxy-6-oxonona-2,4-dienedioate hydrolase